MPRITKQVSRVIQIPEVWTFDPVDDDGNKELTKPVTYELGGGTVRIFSLSEQDRAEINDESIKTDITKDGITQRFSAKLSNEMHFSARLGGDKGSWSGFENEDGEPLNCTVANQKRFAHFEGLRNFVCKYVGPMLDRIATGKAEESEKNCLKSLSVKPGSERPPEATEVAEVAE